MTRWIGFKDIHEEFKELAKQCVGVVEATSFEKLSIWQYYSPQSHTKGSHPATSWVQKLSGGAFCAGDFGDMPVNIEFTFECINGKWVMFYDPCSMVVDHRLVEKWLDDHMSHAKHTNAMNFHNIMHHIYRLNEGETV